MKKNILKVMAMIFSVALLMAGCATVSKVKINGKEAYFKTPVYSQGQVLVIGDYLYYANGYLATDDDDFNYKEGASYGYLSRINLTKDFVYSSKVEEEDKMYTSPKGIEKVVKDKLVGYEKQNMFALGSYIYFTSPNTHKTSQLEDAYERVSLFRVKFDGSGLKEIVKNSAFKQGDGCTIEMQKGSDNNYYYIIVEPGDDSTFVIKSLKIGDKLGKIKTIAEDVTSYAIADETSSAKNIIYTTNSEQVQATTSVKTVDFATGKVTEYDESATGSTTKLMGRAGDEVFYSYSYKAVEEIYHKNIANGEGHLDANNHFYNAKKISGIKKLGEGYCFLTESGALMYKTLGGESVKLMTSEDFSDVLFVENDYVYTSNSTSIKRISCIDKNIETILTLSDSELVSGKCGYDGNNIYFYANIPSTFFEDKEEEDKDERIYLFQTDKFGNVKLIGKRA